MPTDRELLTRYAEAGSETAVAEPVRMRGGFVYGAALPGSAATLTSPRT